MDINAQIFLFFKMNFSIQMFNLIYLFIEANVLYCVLAFCNYFLIFRIWFSHARDYDFMH